MIDPALQKALQEADAGRLMAAIQAVRTLSSRSPKRTDALQVLGILLMRAGQHQQALHHFVRAVTLEPGQAIFRVNLANALLESGQPGSAATRFREALALEPGDQVAWKGLQMAEFAAGEPVKALATADQALERWPAWREQAQLKVMVLMAMHRVDQALAFTNDWLARHPRDSGMLSARLQFLNYRRHPREVELAAARAYGAALGGRLQPIDHGRDPERPLRLGLLSGDLRSHSVGFFAESFLARVPADFIPVVFSTHQAPAGDAMARRFQSLLPDWHDVAHLEEDDAGLEREIRNQKIDVLLDLTGHSLYQRLTALRNKPASVIVHALGFPNTMGHPAFDARLVDSLTDPPGSEAWSTEGLLRLDPCFLCYQPPAQAPEPRLPPADAPITFGSFNNGLKISGESVALWSRVLAGFPGSRLLLKAVALEGPVVAGPILQQFEQHGVERGRIEIAPYAASMTEHLQLYGRLHVALDPVPYQGTTTTCEALWMGVPVVVLEGDRHASRVGVSLLAAAGCSQLLAATEDDYVRLAVELAGDAARLAQLRSGLRRQMEASVLLDAEAYARRFYAALRQLWREHCARH